MEQTTKTQLFEAAPIPRAVLTLAIPTVISSLVMVIYNLADTYFVGMLDDAVQNSAVTLAAPVLLAFNAVNNLFGVGASSMMSRGLGRKDYDTVRRSSAFGFYCAAGFGLLFSLLVTAFRSPLLAMLGADRGTAAATGAYLYWTVSWGAVPAILNVVLAYLVRAEGASLHASIGTMSGCLLNMVLDPIFILPWGLGLGAAGAGLATFLSNCFACLYFFVLLAVKRGNTYVCIRPSMFRCGRAVVLGILAVGIPASIQNLLNVTGMTVLNNFTAAFGPNAVAAMGIAQKVNMVPVQIAFGLSQGIMPLVSYNYASGLMRLFMENRDIVACGTRFLRGLCLASPFFCVDFLGVGVFQACGMGKKSLAFAILRKIVLEIPALFLLNRLSPLYGLAYAQLCAEVILAAAAIVALRQIFRRLERRQPRPQGTP